MLKFTVFFCLLVLAGVYSKLVDYPGGDGSSSEEDGFQIHVREVDPMEITLARIEALAEENPIVPIFLLALSVGQGRWGLFVVPTEEEEQEGEDEDTEPTN